MESEWQVVEIGRHIGLQQAVTPLTLEGFDIDADEGQGRYLAGRNTLGKELDAGRNG
jgi:hypothetical protein